MVGFAGYAFTEPEDASTTLARMAEQFQTGSAMLAHRSIVKSGFGICCVAREGAAFGLAQAKTGAGEVVLAVEGNFAPSALRNGSSIKEDAIATLLLERYLEQGAPALYNLNGRYAIAVWDGRTQTIYLINDQLGMRRLCWSSPGQAFLFATEYKALLGWPGLNTELDDLAVAEFATVAYPMEDRTLLKNIHLLLPGHIGKASVHGFKCRPYPKEPVSLSLPTESGSLDEWADALGELLDSIFREYGSSLGGPLYIPTSGGLDSRVVLGFAKRAGIRGIKSISYGHAHTYDVRFGRRIARQAGVPHRYLHLPPSYVQEYAREGISITEGEASAHCFHISILQEAIPAGSDLWTGFLGDVLSGAKLGDYSQIVTEGERIDYLFRHRYASPWLPDEVWKRIVHPKYHDIFLHGARATLKTLLGRQTDHSFEQGIIRTELEQRQRRFTTYHLETLGRHFRVTAPFLDQRVVQFFLAVPIEYLLRQRLYRRMIVRFLPELSRIAEDKTLRSVWSMDESNGVIPTSQATLATMWSGLHPGIRWRLNAVLATTGIRRTYPQLRQWLVPQLRQWLVQLSGGWLGKHDRTAYAHYDEIIRKYPVMFSDILEADELVGPYFDPEGLMDLFQAHLSRRIDASWLIFNIWTLCMWRKQLAERGIA